MVYTKNKLIPRTRNTHGDRYLHTYTPPCTHTHTHPRWRVGVHVGVLVGVVSVSFLLLFSLLV
jgi:hypothetical protein